ncbi:diguanylate cyclase [Qipengyuania sediminis]|uniref:sensor domain-containing diguanylate cyclase n=1 Tax=Qipengyuania sediminis TaxID=1532023 RepID=UPI00105A3305|nr:diguanylate cyclase [Qipengyuania sediminis]
MACVLAAPAGARAIALADAVCTGGADSVEEAFALAADQLNCGKGRFSQRARFVRARIDVARTAPLPPGRLIWQTDPTSFDSMLIRVDYADGSEALIDVDAQMAVRNWDANGGFWVPIDQRAAPLATIDIVIERPHSSAIFTRMSISGYSDASIQNYTRTLLYILICGILLMPIIYDLLFFRILRARFMLWHLMMTAATLLFTLVNSGIVIILWPDIPASVRNWSIYLATALVLLGSARFLLLVVEEGKITPRIARLLTLSALASLGIALLLALDLEALRMRASTLFYASVLPVIAATAAALACALVRGSRVARVLAFAYAGLMIVGLTQLLAIFGVFNRSDYLDESIYAGLVVLVTGTSAAVGDRFMAMKSERDQAQISARKLSAMANSDKLTGLLNRRAFDQTRRLKSGQALLIADIDRFKAINDTYGHQRGDSVLTHAARVIEAAAAEFGAARVYRLGGEEFAVIAPAEDADALAAAAEALRTAVADSSRGADGFDTPDITVSIGAVLGQGQLMHVAFADADEALYRAKEGGRNRCELATASFEASA